MDVEEMYEDLRNLYPELTKAADARYIEIWGSVGLETAFTWFESLAGVVNAQMGLSEKNAEFASVFKYFDTNLGSCSDEAKNCVDVSFVENLFWEVNPQFAADAWATLPRKLQTLYLEFYGRPPTFG